MARAAMRAGGGTAARGGQGRGPDRGALGRRLLLVYAALVYGFLFLPILLVMVTSVNPDGRATFPPPGVTDRWYRDLVSDDQMLEAFRTSLTVGAIVALVATVLGLLAAWGLSRYTFRFKRGVRALFYLPMLVPGVVGGISLVIWFNRIGLASGFWTIVIAHVVHALPYTLTLILTSFYGFDRRLEEASRDLGAGEWSTFRRVTLPLVMPGVIGGALLAFTLSFDEFVLTFFVAGGGVQTLPLVIFSRIRFELSPVINAAAAVVIAVSVLVLLSGQLAGWARARRQA